MSAEPTFESNRAETSRRLSSSNAVLCDLDGVLTPTAKVHAAAWKATFDTLLASVRPGSDADTRPFSDDDYRELVDGRSRLDGVRAFLASRQISLPDGNPGDASTFETVHGIGNRKNAAVRDLLSREQLDPYPGSVALVKQLRKRGIATAVVSASRNCSAVLAAAGIADLFDAQVDGEVAARMGLAGKPAPDTFLAAAEMVGVLPGECAVIEDAIAGVSAGRAGGFGLVIGVARADNHDGLFEAGADDVVADLGELLAADSSRGGSK